MIKNPQEKLGEINISEIKLDKKSQDDVPRILIGLQTLHNDEEARGRGDANINQRSVAKHR